MFNNTFLREILKKTFTKIELNITCSITHKQRKYTKYQKPILTENKQTGIKNIRYPH